MIDYNFYTIGWICAIRAELVAAQELLDEELMDPVPTSKNDNNAYTLGKIGPHHVVIAGLPRGEYGETSAAAAARDMVHTFPNVRIGFMVGIGGGVPTEYDVRLGDVVVGSPSYRSGGLVKYDHGRATQGEGTDLMGFLNQPPVSVLTAITKLSAFHDRRGHNLNQTVDEVLANNPRLLRLGYQRPSDDTDRLYKAGFIHLPRGEKCSAVCPDTNLKPRDPRLEDEDNPKIHYGLIASGSKLMEDSIARDHLAETEHVLCFEMEAAGLANHFPCVAIRGICDYSDSHRGREWQGYAALVAAAYAKELLLQIPPEKIKEEEKMKDILLEELNKRLQPVAKTAVIIEALSAKGKREEELKLLDWLQAADYHAEQHGYLEPQQCQPGTGQHFINSKDFQTWHKTKNSFLLCCGMPGAGKTITTAITIEYLRSKFKDDATVGVAYVFCSYQKRDQQTPQDLFTSFLKQLALSLTPFPKAIRELYEKNYNGRERPSFEDIMTTLRKVVNLFSRTFIMIDALDEHSSWDTLLSHIILLQNQTTANIFLTSRPKPTLPQKLRGCLIHDIQANERDVGLYIDHRMKQMMVVSEHNTELSEGLKADFRKLIKKKLSRTVNGVFLLARIYMDNLKEETNLKGISNFLDNLPTGLRAYADAYEKTIQRIRNQGQKHRDLAKRALAWLTFSQRPLSKEEFRYALSVEDGMSQLDDEDLQSTSVILHVCMDLIKIEDGSNTVSLLHFTTMEYLNANPNCLLSLESPDDPKFINNPSDLQIQRSLAREYYEMKLATTCITYLSFDDFISGHRVYVYEHRFVDKYPLYSYAAMNWAHHARQGEPSSKILDFLNSESHTSALNKGLCFFIQDIQKRLGWASIPEGRVTGLHLTALFGLHRETASLLSSGLGPDIRDDLGQTPLLYASAVGSIDVVTLLLDWHVDPESKRYWQHPDIPRTALSIAAKQGHAGVVKLLLEKGNVNPDSKVLFIKGQLERTPLSFASQGGHLNVVNILLEAQGANLNFQDYDHFTPLHYAVEANRKAIVDLILAKDTIDPNCKDTNGESPLHYAMRYRNTTILKSLLANNNIDPNCRGTNGESPLHYAIRYGDTAIAKSLLAKDSIDPNFRSTNSESLLHYAVRYRHMAIMKSLLAKGSIDTDSRDKDGKSPLHYATQVGAESIVTLLLTKRANPDLRDISGKSPLHYAAEGGHSAIAEILIATKMVDPDSSDTNGRTPLSLAARAGHIAIVKLLLAMRNAPQAPRNSGVPAVFPSILEPRSHSKQSQSLDGTIKAMAGNGCVDVNSNDKDGWTPLFHAAFQGHRSIVDSLLLLPDTNPSVRDVNGRTILSYAVDKKPDIATLLLSYKGVELNLEDSNLRMLFSYAASTWDQSSFRQLLTHDRVKADYKDSSGRTPLSYAAGRGDELSVKLLLQKPDGNPNSMDISGRTPLSYAAAGGHFAAGTLLIADTRVEVDIQDMFGRTPLSYLAENALASIRGPQSQYKMDKVVELRKLAGELLARGGADLFSQDKQGRTPADMLPESFLPYLGKSLLQQQAKKKVHFAE